MTNLDPFLIGIDNRSRITNKPLAPNTKHIVFTYESLLLGTRAAGLFTGEHSIQDQIWLAKIAEYVGFCACRGS